MTELVVLDPSEVATGRTELDITSWIRSPAGVDYGDAAIEQFLSDSFIGSTPVDHRIQNRKIQIPLVLKTVGSTNVATIRSNLQKKIGLIHAEGGFVSREIDGSAVYADVVNATLHLGGSWEQAYRGFDVEATLELETLPDWFGNVVTLDAISATGCITQVLQVSAATAVISGHYPGRVSILVTDTASQDRHGMLWGWRSRYYSNAATAALKIEAEAMTPAGTPDATISTRTGASGGGANNVVGRTLGGTWDDVVVTDLVASGALTHRGSYRVWARTYSTSTDQTVRFLWSVGELAFPDINDSVAVPLANDFALLDLGEVRLDINPYGTHRWTGHVQAKGSGDIEVDVLYFQPLDEGAGQLIAYESDLEPGQTAPAVLYSNRTCLLSTTGMFTETSTAGGYMAMSQIYGDLPRIPVSLLEARPVELFLLATRGDFDMVADAGAAADTLQIKAGDFTYRPSYLFRV